VLKIERSIYTALASPGNRDKKKRRIRTCDWPLSIIMRVFVFACVRVTSFSSVVAAPKISVAPRWILTLSLGFMMKFVILKAWGEWLSQSLIDSFFVEDLAEDGDREKKHGQRKKRVKSLMDDATFVPKLLLLWISCAPLRFFSHWLLGRSQTRTPFSALNQKDDVHPPICDLVNEVWSPVTVMLQFWSNALCNTSVWLRILSDYAKIAGIDVDDFVVNNARRQLAQRHAEAHRRHRKRFQDWPWCFAIIVDHRVPLEQREAMGRRFLAACLFCLDPGFLRKLRKVACFQTLAGMFDVSSQFFLWAVFWSIQVTTAIVECEHARNGRLLASLNAWAYFSANVANADSRSLLRHARDTGVGKLKLSRKLDAIIDAAGIHNAPATCSKLTGNLQSGIQQYHSKRMQEEKKRTGKGIKADDLTFWAKVCVFE
jgi:hypothetical protein